MTARTSTAAGLAAAVLALAAPALASAPPVGPLPAGPTTTISTARGELVAVWLPAQPAGRVWRLKGSIDTKVVREVSEANVGGSKNVVVVFRAVGPGTARLSYGATRGETAKAYAAKRFVVNVR
jgi:hypothetical protein